MYGHHSSDTWPTVLYRIITLLTASKQLTKEIIQRQNYPKANKEINRFSETINNIVVGGDELRISEQ